MDWDMMIISDTGIIAVLFFSVLIIDIKNMTVTRLLEIIVTEYIFILPKFLSKIKKLMIKHCLEKFMQIEIN